MWAGLLWTPEKIVLCEKKLVFCYEQAEFLAFFIFKKKGVDFSEVHVVWLAGGGSYASASVLHSV